MYIISDWDCENWLSGHKESIYFWILHIYNYVDLRVKVKYT